MEVDLSRFRTLEPEQTNKQTKRGIISENKSLKQNKTKQT